MVVKPNQNRFKSKVLWVSLAGAIVSFLVGSGIIDLGLADSITDLINLIALGLVAFGILNDPTNQQGF